MPSSPSSLPSALVLLFAVACGLSVANVYYAQPLLDVLGAEFAIGQAGVGLLFGATQAGCAWRCCWWCRWATCWSGAG